MVICSRGHFFTPEFRWPSAGKSSIKANNSLHPSSQFASDPFKCVKFKGHKGQGQGNCVTDHGPAGVLSPVQGPSGSSLLYTYQTNGRLLDTLMRGNTASKIRSMT